MNFQMKMGYKTQKHMKKLYGKNLGREIAFGRNLVKFMKDKYQPERLNPEGVNSIQKDGILSPDWQVRLVNACESPNTTNK